MFFALAENKRFACRNDVGSRFLCRRNRYHYHRCPVPDLTENGIVCYGFYQTFNRPVS